MYDVKCEKTHISTISVHKYHKSCSYLTDRFISLLATVWVEITTNSYLRDFSGEVSRSVFLASFTVLGLITTLWLEMSEISYLRDISANVSQNVFLAYLTVLRLLTTLWPEMSKNFLSSPFQCTSMTNRFLSLFDRLTAYYNCITWNVQKTHISSISVHKYHKSCSLAYLTVLPPNTSVWCEMSENSYLHHFSLQVSQIVFLTYMTVLHLITNELPEI